MVVMQWRIETNPAGDRVLSAAWTPITVPELPSQQAVPSGSQVPALRAS